MKIKFPNYKVLIAALVTLSAFVIYAKVAGGVDKFSPAKDFPNGALVYIQFADLNKAFDLWENSRLKSEYLNSINYEEFRNRHLALKIAERWNEFNSAFPMPLEAKYFKGLSETKAAVAVYDIGKLEFVFIAPMSDEKILASYFFRYNTGFEKNSLADGEVFYRKEIEVDRRRQKQQLLFANFRGRLILATNEALFFRTLATLKDGKNSKSLADEYEFKTLAEKAEPHLVSVWVDQAKLNDDWYFRHYWLMNDPSELKAIRAGMFDFELRENEIVEKRLFLRSDDMKKPDISAGEIVALRNLIPADTPFYRITSFDRKDSKDLFRKTLLDNYSVPRIPEKRHDDFYYSDDYGDEDHYYPSEDFDVKIDDAEEAGISDETQENPLLAVTEARLLDEFQNVLDRAGPKAFVYLTNPQSRPDPLFLKTQKALILSLKNQANLNREALESSISDLLENRLTVVNSGADFRWRTKTADGIDWREVSAPFLEWSFSYALQNGRLILSNDGDFLNKILTNKTEQPDETSGKPLNELTVINFARRQTAFDEVMKTLVQSEDSETGDFFTGNIGSLLDVLSDVETIEISRSGAGKFATETIEYR